MKAIFLSLVILGSTVLACKKSDTNPSCDPNVTTLTGIYKTTAIIYKANSSGMDQDIFSTLDACEKDNEIILNSNGIAQYIDIGLVCSPNANSTSTWSISGNTITMDGTIGSIQFFDCKKLIVITSPGIFPGDIYKVTYEKK